MLITPFGKASLATLYQEHPAKKYSVHFAHQSALHTSIQIPSLLAIVHDTQITDESLPCKNLHSDRNWSIEASCLVLRPLQCGCFDYSMHIFKVLEAPITQSITKWRSFIYIIRMNLIPLTLVCSEHSAELRAKISSPVTESSLYYGALCGQKDILI